MADPYSQILGLENISLEVTTETPPSDEMYRVAPIYMPSEIYLAIWHFVNIAEDGGAICGSGYCRGY